MPRLCDAHPGDASTEILEASDVPQATRDAIYAYAASVGQTSFACPNSKVVPNTPMYFGHTSAKFPHAWAVQGSKTATGAALLIRDLQTPATFPAIWHKFAVSGKAISARGVGVPGNPGILAGWNEKIAWGVTAAGFSQIDLFRIEMRPGTTDSYMLDRSPTMMSVDNETIRIKGEDALEVQYKETVFGPVVTEFIPNTNGEEFAARLILPWRTAIPTRQSPFLA